VSFIKFFPSLRREKNLNRTPRVQNPASYREVDPKYGKKTDNPILNDPKNDKIGIGEYFFRQEFFPRINQIHLVRRFPRWKDGIRPHML